MTGNFPTSIPGVTGFPDMVLDGDTVGNPAAAQSAKTNSPTSQASSGSATASSPPANVAPWAKRQIQVTFTPVQGQAVTLTGLRTLCQVSKASLPGGFMMSLRIWGMSLAHINTFSKAGNTFIYENNKITVAAGDAGGQLTQVFSGVIIDAFPDFNNQPDVGFVVEAAGSYGIQLSKATAVSFPGPVSGQQALTQILQPAGIQLQNNGVKAMLQSPYFPGGVWQQLNRCVRALNCMGAHDPVSNTVTIWPKPQFGANNAPGSPVLIAPETGMVGYPTFQRTKIIVRTLFTPSVLMTPGHKVKIKSQLTSAAGIADAYMVDLNLSSELPNGPWEAIVYATPAGSGIFQ